MEKNEKDLTLVIMAAGMGSRFGGLKQIEPVGPNGEYIIDYSIKDAIKAGFTKVVFIIKDEMYDVFRETIGKRIEQEIKVEYAFQRIDNVPEEVVIPEERVKPWGTSHAILSAVDKVDGDFAVINADDFYGYDAYEKAADFLKNGPSDEYGLIGYEAKNTLTENGSVKRGVCSSKDGYLTFIKESSVENINGTIIASPLDGSDKFVVEANSPVSMNFFCFRHNIFDVLKEEEITFFEKNKDNLLKCEFLIPETAFAAVEKGVARIKMVHTTAEWRGVTYKEDKPKLVEDINRLIEKGVYEKKLWQKY